MVERWSQSSAGAEVIKAYAIQLDHINVQLDQLQDAVIERLIDKDTYHKRQAKLLFEQTKIRNLHEKSPAKHLQPALVAKFLELIKNLRGRYTIAPPADKREIVEIASSNRTVSGKIVYVQPSSWLRTTQTATILVQPLSAGISALF